MHRHLLVLSVLSVMGCKPAPVLSPGATNVRVMKADPPAGCKELGDVRGNPGDTTGDEGAKVEEAKIDARNKTAAKGGNYFRWDTLDPYSSTALITGTAYECPATLKSPTQESSNHGN
jgi:hypothetical protein